MRRAGLRVDASDVITAPGVTLIAGSAWWRACTWQKHRNAVEDVRLLLEEVQRQRGTGFMTVEHVLAVLDAKDPDALVASWMPEADRTSGLPIARRCQWRGCRREKAGEGPAARYCVEHATLKKRQADRAYERRRRASKRAGPGVGKLTAETRVLTAS